MKIWNATIHTMTDAGILENGYVCIENGKITAVESGKPAELSPEDIDAGGSVLLPGFIDAHSHICSYADTLDSVPLGGAKSFEQIAALLKAFIAENDLTHIEVVMGFGYDHNFLAEKTHPTKELLDQVSADKPILITHQSGHMAVANSAFLKLSGLNDQTPDPEGGHFGRLENGELSGLMEETAFFMAAGCMGEGSIADKKRRLAKAQDIYLSYGVTTAQEGMLGAANDVVLQQLAAEETLKIDIVGYADIKDAHDLLEGHPERKIYQDHYRLGGYKIILDGSPQGRTAWLSQPYEGSDDCAYGAYSDEEVYQFLRKAALEGEQVLAHCNGDAASEQLISQYERIVQEVPGAQIVRPDDPRADRPSGSAAADESIGNDPLFLRRARLPVGRGPSQKSGRRTGQSHQPCTQRTRVRIDRDLPPGYPCAAARYAAHHLDGCQSTHRCRQSPGGC